MKYFMIIVIMAVIGWACLVVRKYVLGLEDDPPGPDKPA